jgi:hypothetical protein
MNINQEFINLGRNDKAYTYISKWKLLKLDVVDKKGVWSKIQQKLKDLKDAEKLEIFTGDQVRRFFLTRPEIDMEINFFSELMPTCLVFKYKRKIYCYTYGKVKRKNGRKIIVRFYFNLNKVLSLDLPI